MLTRMDLRDLRPPTDPDPPVVLHRTDVPADTWAGLLADGAYRRLTTTAALRADVGEDAARRAHALVTSVPDRAVVGRRSAAWVHLGGDPPPYLDLLVAPGQRLPPDPARTCHQTLLSTRDVIVLGGCRVTTPTRTLADLALVPDAHDLWPVLAQLTEQGADPVAALACTARTARQRGVRRARALLTELIETC